MTSTIVVLDTETTGTDPQTSALLEVAWVPVSAREDEHGPLWDVVGNGGSGDAMVRFDGEIPPEARAVHHISPADVAEGSGALPRSSVIKSLLDAEEPGDMMYAAHNAPFDAGFLPELTLPWIDTYRCALHLYPDAPSYKNQVLRYYLGLEPRQDLLEGLAPHRALYDTAVTAELLLRMLQERTPEELLELSTKPILLLEFPFGKHKGAIWDHVPTSYINWMIKENVRPDDVDLWHSVEHHTGMTRPERLL